MMIAIKLDDLESQIAIALKKAGIGTNYIDCLLDVIMREIRSNHGEI
jgi:hypothetical protein